MNNKNMFSTPSISREEQQLLENISKKENQSNPVPVFKKTHQHHHSEYKDYDFNNDIGMGGGFNNKNTKNTNNSINSSNNTSSNIQSNEIDDPIEKDLRKKMYSMLSRTINSNSNNNTTNESLTNSLNTNNNSSYYNSNNIIADQSGSSKKNKNQFLNNSNSGVNLILNTSLSGTNKSPTSNTNHNLNQSSGSINNTYLSNPNNSPNQSFEDELELNRSYVVVERSRLKSYQKEYKFEIEREYEIIKEYKLYVVEDWIYKSNHQWTAIVFSGNQNDKIIASIIKPQVQSKNLNTMINKPPNSTFYQIHTTYGELLLANYSVKTSQIKLVEIPDGDFDSHIERIKLNLSLKRLGCTKPNYQLSVQPVHVSVEKEFIRLSGRKFDSNTVVEFIKEIQASLSNLNYLPQLTKIDGCYDQKMINAVKAFQMDFYKQRNKGGLDPTTAQETPSGYLNESTFRGIVNEIYLLKKKIETFLPSKKRSNIDPVKNYNEFSNIIKDFQDTYSIYPDAPGKNIHLYIEKLKMNLENLEGDKHGGNGREINYSSDVEGGDIIDDDSDSNEDSDDSDFDEAYYESDNFTSENDLNTSTDILSPSSPSIPIKNQNQNINNMHSYSPSSPQSTGTPTIFYPSPSNSSPSITSINKSKPQQQPQQVLNNNPNQTVNNPQTTLRKNSHSHSISQDNNTTINDLETIEDAKEKEILKETILKLENLLEQQQQEYCKLKNEFDKLSDSYYDIKEQSLRSIAIVQTNEKIFNEMTIKYNKILKQELPEIEEKVTSNLDFIQSYSNRLKRLDDIVESVQRKNDRNIFSIITVYLMSLGSLVAVFFAYLIMFFSGIKKKWSGSSPNNSAGDLKLNKSNNKTHSRNSSNSNSLENDEIKHFISRQRLKITELMEDLDDNDSLQQSPKFHHQ